MTASARPAESSDPTRIPAAPAFQRALRLRDLILFGIICVQPVAPIPAFGLVESASHGHAATTIAIAMLAMLPTACSYGWMAARYPSAGSAYTYVTQALHPTLGFLAGWAMILDYLLIPIFNVIYFSATMQRVVPDVPYLVWASLFAASITTLNLRGIRVGMRANRILVAIMGAVIVAAIYCSVTYLQRIHGIGGLWSVAPFYQRAVFDVRALAAATSFAAITYIGFDAVTTLAEEVEDPTRTVARAATLVCLITGIGSILIVYLAQLAWPQYQLFTDLDTAYLDVCQRIGGVWLLAAMAAALIIAAFGAGLTGQAGAARLCFGMGRSGVLPRRFFAHVNQRTLQPSNNVWLVGVVALAGGLLLDLEGAAELLNFGAFLAFMGVNLAAFRCGLAQRKHRKVTAYARLLVSVVGFASCLAIWLTLPLAARRVGFAWLVVGIVYQAIRNRQFLFSRFARRGS